MDKLLGAGEPSGCTDELGHGDGVSGLCKAVRGRRSAGSRVVQGFGVLLIHCGDSLDGRRMAIRAMDARTASSVSRGRRRRLLGWAAHCALAAQSNSEAFLFSVFFFLFCFFISFLFFVYFTH